MTRYQLSLEAENLPRRFCGCLRNPNPYAVVRVSGGPKEGTVVGQTEPIRHTVQPDWVECLFLETDASIYMPLRISIWDDRGPNFEDALIAEVTFEAIEIYQSVGHIKSETLPNGAVVYAILEESVKGSSLGAAHMHLRALDMKNVEPGLLGLGRTDPFYEISKKNADYAAGVVVWNCVYRSEHIWNHLNPYWKPFSIGMEELCYGDATWPLRVTVKDWQAGGKHRVIGEFETTFQSLTDHVSVRGNADRELAFELFKEEQLASLGLVVVVKAEFKRDGTAR